MTDPAAEFSRLVPLTRLASGRWRQEIAAEPEECVALAARFGLVSLDRLAASVELRRGAGGIVLLEATIEAAFVQNCVVSLDPVPGTISASFALRYGPPEAEERDPELPVDEPAFEAIAGEAIDIGEAVAQELSLQLPAFPRLPGAELDALGDAEPVVAALADAPDQPRTPPPTRSPSTGDFRGR
jgi:uncharacterized metal-binding protein YceD (DUF177 family)